MNVQSVFGVLFSERLPRLNITPQVISWIFTVHGFSRTIGILFTKHITSKFGYRKICFLNSFITSVNFVLLSIARTPAFFFLLYGFLIRESSNIAEPINLFKKESKLLSSTPNTRSCVQRRQRDSAVPARADPLLAEARHGHGAALYGQFRRRNRLPPADTVPS